MSIYTSAGQQYEDRLRAALSDLPIVIWATDADGVVQIGEGRVEDLGFKRGELVGRSVFEVYDDDAPIVEAHRRALAGEQLVRSLEVDGHFFEAHYSPVRDDDGVVTGVIGVAADVTKRTRAESELRESEAKYRYLVETSHDVIWALDRERVFTFVNQAVRHTHGYEPEQVAGKKLDELVVPERLADDVAITERVYEGGAVYQYETEHLRRDGGRVVLSMNALPLRDADGRIVGATGTALDITERKRFEAELQYFADHDPLTGLFNRRRFEQELTHEIASHARYGRIGALLVLDLDNFKYVNDTLGHAAGDELLGAVARLLDRRLREADVCGRIGGDEFAVLLPFTDAEHARTLAAELAERLREQAIVVDGKGVRVTTSIGLTEFGAREVTGTELLVEADTAMYEAKDAGRDRFAFYTAADGERVRASMTWAERIRDALEADDLVVEAQPILDVQTGRISRYELLLRMRGRDGELVPPAAFLTTAARFGSIGALDRWVVGRAVDLLAERDEGLKLEVNLSARSFADPELPRFIEERVDQAGVDPARLIFEITETEAIANLDDAREFAGRLTGLGCRFALDDFGTGFGSFHYLKYLPLDYIKIDGDFVRDIASTESDRLMVKAMVDVARGMGMATVAEFVETEQALDALRSLGVDFAQGYFVGRPGPLP